MSQINREDIEALKYIEKRTDLIITLLDNMALFKEPWIQEYIERSIRGEINMAFNIGRFRQQLELDKELK